MAGSSALKRISNGMHPAPQSRVYLVQRAPAIGGIKEMPNSGATAGGTVKRKTGEKLAGVMEAMRLRILARAAAAQNGCGATAERPGGA